MIKIYHNGSCSKSRSALHILEELNHPYEVVNYPITPLIRDELMTLIAQLGISAEDLIRKTEPVFKEQFNGASRSDSEWIDVLLEHPILMERPVVVAGNSAVIARPPEKLHEFLKSNGF